MIAPIYHLLIFMITLLFILLHRSFFPIWTGFPNGHEIKMDLEQFKMFSKAKAMKERISYSKLFSKTQWFWLLIVSETMSFKKYFKRDCLNIRIHWWSLFGDIFTAYQCTGTGVESFKRPLNTSRETNKAKQNWFSKLH